MRQGCCSARTVAAPSTRKLERGISPSVSKPLAVGAADYRREVASASALRLEVPLLLRTRQVVVVALLAPGLRCDIHPAMEGLPRLSALRLGLLPQCHRPLRETCPGAICLEADLPLAECPAWVQVLIRRRTVTEAAVQCRVSSRPAEDRHHWPPSTQTPMVEEYPLARLGAYSHMVEADAEALTRAKDALHILF